MITQLNIKNFIGPRDSPLELAATVSNLGMSM